MLTFLFDRAITESIDVKGLGDDLFEQLNSNILHLFLCDMPLLEEGWSVGWG